MSEATPAGARRGFAGSSPDCRQPVTATRVNGRLSSQHAAFSASGPFARVVDSKSTDSAAAPRRRLLYIHMAALGDAIMASPALRILREGLPGAQVDVLARRAAADYFSSLTSVDQVVPFVAERFVDRHRPWKLLQAPGELARLIRTLRDNRYDAVVQWRGQIPDTLMSACTRARHRVAAVQSIHRRSIIPVERVSFLVTDLVPVADPGAHLVEAMAAPARHLVHKLGGLPEREAARPLEFPLRTEDERAADAFMAAHDLREDTPMAIVAISAKTAVNSWPGARFGAVADYLRLSHGLRVILSGVPEHRDRETEIAAGMKTQPLCSTGRLPFGGVCALLRRCRLLVALNTGISHAAAALRVPVVVLSGRDGASITPWGTPHRVVTRNPFYPARHPDPREWAGLVEKITPAEVKAAIDALLEDSHA